MSKLSTLGIIAGKGNLPAQIIRACQSINRPFFVINFEESFVPEAMKNIPHAVVRIGAVGEALKYLRGAGAREIVMAGAVKRPSLSSLRPDAAGASLLKKLGKAFFSGDDAILKAIIAFFEEENFTIVAVDSILTDILADEGVLGKISPDKQANNDIIIGMKTAKDIGALDIGQGVIVENGVVLGTESADGTDAMIVSCGKLRKGKKTSGVLVKAKKPKQEEKVDLPSIGVQTIENLYKAGFAGVAIEAHGSLLIDKFELIKKADEYGLFVVGAKYE
ncbi:MAG: UDP-2,3-diacylglucosamine diphosphatase LpxI [Rickettsiales bacterium]